MEWAPDSEVGPVPKGLNNVALMLSQRRRRWTNIKTALVGHFVFVELSFWCWFSGVKCRRCYQILSILMVAVSACSSDTYKLILQVTHLVANVDTYPYQ